MTASHPLSLVIPPSFTGVGIPYTIPFGVDGTWGGAPNMLQFYNSLKMKTSVIFGVCHMVFGIMLSLVNALHFRRPLNIFFEFIPQLALMLSLFGYLTGLIFLKWTKYYSPGYAPYLINPMINMFLKPMGIVSNSTYSATGQLMADGVRTTPDAQLFPGQLYVQWGLLAVALISVPIMLLVKPCILAHKHKRRWFFFRVVYFISCSILLRYWC